MNDVSTRLTKCFSAVFPELTPDEIPMADLHSVPKWDSLATITLLALIEEEFDLRLDPGELENLVSYESILTFLRLREKHAS